MHQKPLSNFSNHAKRMSARILLEKARAEALQPLPENVVTQSHRENHPTKNKYISHYSLFRKHSIITHFEDDTPNQSHNYYVTRTISYYPQEEIQITYSGILMQKNAQFALFPFHAQEIFLEFCKRYQLADLKI